MSSNKKRLLTVAFLSVALLIIASAAFAAHPPVNLLDVNGAPVTSTTPYSPKQTCSLAACHQSPDPAVAGPAHTYGEGTKLSSHTQGVIAADNKIYWQTFDVKAFEHGVSVGRHASQGRDEDFSNAFRANFGLPFFTGTPGMFGKY
jgi:hypothetical protein